MADSIDEKVIGKLDSIQLKMDERLNDITEKVDAGKQISEAAKTEIAELSKKHEETIAELSQQINDIQAKSKELLAAGQKFYNPLEQMQKAFEGGAKGLKSLYDGETSRHKIDLGVKAADMTMSVATTGAVVPPAYVPGIFMQPDRRHIRDFMAQGNTISNNVPFTQETAFDNGSALTGEGATKPQSDFDLTLQDGNVRKLAHYMRLSKEMLADIPGLQSYVGTRGVQKLLQTEDGKILFAAGGSDIIGLFTSGTAYTPVGFGSTVSRWDVLSTAITQATVDIYYPNLIILHPNDANKLYISKDGQGEYRVPEALISGLPLRIKGVPVLENTAMTEGKFIVGDFRMGAQLFFRENVSAEFFYEDRDNAIKNMVTVVIEERLVLNTYHPKAFRYGDWAQALAVGSGGSVIQ